MATTITIPDFDWSSFYYADILEALIQYKRVNCPELTDESEFEPAIQMLRAFALVGHLNNVLTDLVANESTLPTAKLVETVRNMLRLIDYEMRAATPAQVDIVYELARVFTFQYTLVREGAQAATAKEGSDPVIYFEADEVLTIDRTDEFSYVFADEGGTFTDFTAEANSPTTPADDWTPWASPAVGDAIYFGHKQVMFDTLSALLTTAASGITGVWEFYDGDAADAEPTDVTLVGGTLEFDLTTLLGLQNRQGTTVRVTYNETGAYEDVQSTWNGLRNIATTGYLGQPSPSDDRTKYSIGSEWDILEVDSELLDFTADGKVEYTLPQSVTQYWQPATVNTYEAYWLRYRIVEVSSPTSPTIQRARMDEGKQYVLRSATQGRTKIDNPLGNGTGLQNQEFQTSTDHYIDGTMEFYVEGVAWAEVDNFLNSLPGDKHFQVVLGENDRATIKTGDGLTGAVPPVGVGNVWATYRYGGDNDGNVGANKVSVDKSGLNYINKLWNPRQAAGWAEAQGATEESLERAKIEGPASLRTKTVAIGPTDVEELTVAFTDEEGATPFSRAIAYEELYGPKTVGIIVVAKGGAAATADQLAALELYFNGDQYAIPPVAKHLISNQEASATNYTPREIDVTATVYGDVEPEAVRSQLGLILQPEAQKEGTGEWEWHFGAEVPVSRISHEIFETDESITKVEITEPAADIQLLSQELPTAGTITITVVEPT